MLPFISQEAKRNINLGGARSQSSHEAILSHARALRNSRRDERLKEDATIKIQRWIKARRQGQALRDHIRSQFDLGPRVEQVDQNDIDLMYVKWTRLLVLGSADEERISRWSIEIMSREELLLGPFNGPWRENWLVLIRQIALILLKSISRDPVSPAVDERLRVLTKLLSFASWERLFPGVPGAPLTQSTLLKNIARYLLHRNMMMYLARALQQMPLSQKKGSETSVRLSQLLGAPFVIFDESKLAPLESSSIMPITRSPYYNLAFLQFLTHVLSVPLLPNRIPLSEIPKLVSCVPWNDLPLIISSPLPVQFTPPATIHDLVLSVQWQLRPHLLANLLTFVPSRYSKLSDTVLSAYLELYATLLDTVELGSLEALANKTNPSVVSTVKHATEEEDSENEDITMDEDSPGSPSIVIPQSSLPIESDVVLDVRTVSRLATLTSPGHLSSLLAATSRSAKSREQLFKFVLSLTIAFPSKSDLIWTTISVVQGGGSGLIRECWRGYVRSSPLGKVEDERAVKVLMDPVNAPAWPAVLFLVSLYTHSLFTVGDDEFFSLSAASGAARNPLTLDDLVTFSRQLLNIAFPLYWSEDQAKVKESGPAGIRLTWQKVRELISDCLKGIHARDSRRPFTPKGHWLVTSQVDLHSFVEAAVTEEQTLFDADSEPISTPRTRHRRNGLSPRQLAHLSPRLGILNNIPFAIPFEVRVEIFRQFIRNDYSRTFSTSDPGLMFFRSGFDGVRRKKVTVRREHIAQDGFDQLSNLRTELKGPVEIQFIDKFGQEEAGIDGGGVFKEFLTSLSKEAFDTNRGLWLSTARQELYPNPHSYATEAHQLNWYRFIGQILGKALYEGILVDVAFASFFLAKWLGKQSYLDDLASLDPELYNGLIFLKRYDKNFEDLSLNFTISVDDFGVARTVNLIPNGDQVSVTRENRLQYIYLVSHYRLSRQIKRQSEAFFEGLSDIIDPKWLRMFNQQEAQILVSGVNSPVDLGDLRQNCNYGGLYDDDEETIQMFWKVVNSFDHEQRRGLLRFVTSCGRPPLLGFKELYPKFSIRDSSDDEQRLPTSSTCVNLLKLPRYKHEKIMREKLLQAINSGAGFDLS